MPGVFNWTNVPLLKCDECLRTILKVNENLNSTNMYTQWVRDNLGDRHIYVSLTTSPARVATIHFVLHALDLTHVQNVLVTVPYKYKNKTPFTLNERLFNKFPKVSQHRTTVVYPFLSPYYHHTYPCPTLLNPLFFSLFFPHRSLNSLPRRWTTGPPPRSSTP